MIHAVLVLAAGAILFKQIRYSLTIGEGGRGTNSFELLRPLSHPEQPVQDGLPLKVSS